MATYRRVHDSRHLQADCQEPGSAPEPYARLSSMGYLFYLLTYMHTSCTEASFSTWTLVPDPTTFEDPRVDPIKLCRDKNVKVSNRMDSVTSQDFQARNTHKCF